MERKLKYIFYIIIFIISLLTRSIVLNHLANKKENKNVIDTPLKDSLHDIIPRVEGNNAIILGYIKEITTTIPFLFLFLFTIKEKNYKILFDFIKLFAIILFIRTFSFYLTVLPDSSERCDPNITMSPNGACHDLLFSGHTTFQILSILYLYYYSETWQKLPNTIKMNFMLLIPANAYLILATRDHYSIDILYAFIVTYSMFYFNHTCFKPGMLCIKD